MATFKVPDYLTLILVFMAVAAAMVWLQTQEGERTGYKTKLSFRSNGGGDSATTTTKTFKILQLADLHMGEAENTDWGPLQDTKTFRVLDSIIPVEQPDLIVLSGDQLTANNIGQNATAYYYRLCVSLAKYGIPWAMIFGNHDDMPLTYHDANGSTVSTNQTKTSREDLFRVDNSFAPLSLTQRGPSGLFGTSNYILNVYSDDTATTVGLQLLFLDSGGGTLPKQLESNQVEWFQTKRTQHSGVPLVAFQHIPTVEFAYNGNICQGLQDDGVDSIQKDPGIVNVLHDDGNAHFLAVGHNHGNDYCCPYKSAEMHVCFGRHSGYGGYGSWDRGARVYELQLVASEENMNQESPRSSRLAWRSWVRMESGDIQDEYNPYSNDNGNDDNDENE